MSKNIIKESSSVLIAKKIFIENMQFNRLKITNEKVEFSNSEIEKNIVNIGENEYKSSLSLKMSNEDESVNLKIVISGIFEINADVDEQLKTIIITKNTMAILFPYLRSQITLLTAQPDIIPVILPAININTLLENLEKKD